MGLIKVKLFIAAVLGCGRIGCGAPVRPAQVTQDPAPSPAQLGFEDLRSSAFQVNVATEHLIDAFEARKQIVKTTRDRTVKAALVEMGRYLQTAGEQLADYAEKPDQAKIGNDLAAQAELKERAAKAHDMALKSLANAKNIAQQLAQRNPDTEGLAKLASQVSTVYDTVEGARAALKEPTQREPVREAMSGTPRGH